MFFTMFLVFRSLIMICLSIDFFGLSFFGVYWASWICRVLSGSILRRFSGIISLYMFLAPVFLLYLMDSDGLNIRHECYCFLGPWSPAHFQSFSLFGLHSTISIDLSSSSLTPLSFPIFYWAHPVSFFILVIVFFSYRALCVFLNVSFLRISIFPFISRTFIIICWTICIVVTVKCFFF